MRRMETWPIRLQRAARLAELNAAELAARPEARRPDTSRSKEWRKHRLAAGQMVVVRSHFKSIYLIPMAAISLICGIWMVFGTSGAQLQAGRAPDGLHGSGSSGRSRSCST